MMKEPSVRVRLIVGLLALAAGGTGAVAAPPLVAPREAITRAVEQRLGRDAVVTVTAVATSVAPETGLSALPDPSARIGKPARFVLIANGSRRGQAVATVRVWARFPRAARAIARDEEIGDGALDFSESDLPPVPLQPLLDASDIVGVRARRAIAAGEPLTPSVLRVEPLVRSGEAVTLTVRIGAVEASGSGVASGSGHVGDVIRVLQRHTTRPVKARITGRGHVEMVQ